MVYTYRLHIPWHLCSRTTPLQWFKIFPGNISQTHMLCSLPTPIIQFNPHVMPSLPRHNMTCQWLLPLAAGDKKKAAATAGSSRGTSYTIAEDKALCSAYLNVSRDPIVGTNQKSETYWERITNYYNDLKVGCYRTACSLTARWGVISKDTSLFCGIKAEVDRLRQSGKTEQDRVRTRCLLSPY